MANEIARPENGEALPTVHEAWMLDIEARLRDAGRFATALREEGLAGRADLVDALASALRTAREDAARARREGADDVIDLVESHDVGQDIYHEWRYWPEKKRFGYSTLREAIDAAQTATSRNAQLSTPVDPGADRAVRVA